MVCITEDTLLPLVALLLPEPDIPSLFRSASVSVTQALVACASTLDREAPVA